MSLSRPIDVDAIHSEVGRALKKGRADTSGAVLRALLLFSLVFALMALIALLATTWADAQPVVTTRLGDFLDAPQSPNNLPALAGVSQGLRGTFWIAVVVLTVAIPLGIAAAVYLEEYASKNRLSRFIELNIRNLAGVPSVVYGLLGAAIFVELFRGFIGADGLSARTLVSGGLTLAVLVLPIIIITSAEALRAVPQGLREGAYGVGATKWEVVRSQVLPYAAPGILTGALLAMARAIGEAAPLIIVGAAASLSGGGLDEILEPGALGERFTAMPNLVGNWVGYQNEAYRVNNTAAAIMVLLVFVLLLNSMAVVLRNRYEKRRNA